jgi:hypothetical protein
VALIPDRFPGERLIIKIWKTLIERGIGGLLSAWQNRRLGKASADVKAYELRVLAQAKRDAAEIRAGRKRLDYKGRLIEAAPAPAEEVTKLPPPDIMNFLQQIHSEEAIRQFERAINLHSTIALAEEGAARVKDEEVSDKPVDPDWFTRWRANVEDVESEGMQRLWARILTDEFKQPGSFSLHTLDFVRRISMADAKLIETLGPAVSSAGYIAHDGEIDPVLVKMGLSLDALLELEDLGVVRGIEALGLIHEITSAESDRFASAINYGQVALILSGNDPNTKVRLHIYQVARVGRQVLSLGSFAPDMEYISAVATFIERTSKLKVTLADVVEVVGDRLKTTNERPFPPLNS